MSEKIVIRCAFTTRYQPTVRYAAIKLAWCMGLTFTVQGLAGATGKPVNGALRRALSGMVAEGELFSFLGKNRDGKIARYYCAQQSKQFEWGLEKVS